MTIETESQLSVDRQEPEFITDLSPRGHTRGLAETDPSGRVRKNPEPVVGDIYLVWNSPDEPGSLTFVATYHEGGFAALAYIPQPDEELPTLRHTSSMTVLDVAWVKARFDTPVITDEQMEVSVAGVQFLNDELDREAEWFDTFSDGLNELAERHGWCNQYDDIVRDLGMPGREKEYWVEAEVTCTLTDDNPSGRLDSVLEQYYGASFDTTRVEITGKVTVRVNGIKATGDDAAQGMVTREDVFAAVDGMFSGDVDMDDWEVKDSGEEDY